MDEIGPVRGGDASKHAVEGDDDGNHRDKHKFRLHPEQFRPHQRHGHFTNRGEEHCAIDHIIKAAKDRIGHAH